ncbi:hypothetical protein WAI453_004115 [Rhynchosporium graminicola]|uniref:Uncharacterized protein n=1 Tax=Rhynchosporium graminicola TaxID=2792576 RepID=A0A1E1JXF1_9HELO|nr:uncharacterized protein RCO7_06851 [Rhynchosporium commune]
MKLWQAWRSLGKRFRSNRSDNSGETSRAYESDTSECVEITKAEETLIENFMNPRFSHDAENAEQKPLHHTQQDTQQVMANKVQESGLRFEQMSRKPHENQVFEFLMWLPGAVKNKVGEMKGKRSRGGRQGGERKYAKEEDEKKEKRSEEGYSEHDAGVCIVRVIPRKPDQDIDAVPSKGEGRLMIEVTTSEWKEILAMRKRKATGLVPVENEKPSDVYDGEEHNEKQEL